MTSIKKIGIMIVLGLLGLLIYMQLFYNPCGNRIFKFNSHNNYNLVIANEGSHFKDSVVRVLIQHYSNKPINIKTIPLSALSQIDTKDYNAIVIIHSWYTWNPPPEVEKFIQSQQGCLNNIVVLTTSYHGSLKMDEVDAITGSSKIMEVEMYASIIIDRLNLLLNY
jgi:hypothetical protein